MKKAKQRKSLSSISKKEWYVVFAITLALVLVSLIPLIAGYSMQTDEKVFMGIPQHVTDTNNHLNLAQQAKEGNILLENRFTGEDMPALFFNPYHLVVGWTSAITHLSVTSAFNIIAIITSIGFFLTLFWFIAQCTPNRSTRLKAFIIASTASGFGLWWLISRELIGLWYGSSDLWITEMTSFQSISQPHFALATMLMLFMIVFFFRSVQSASKKENNKWTIWAGVMGLLLSVIHLFDIVTIAVLFVAWFIYVWVKEQSWPKKMFKSLLITGAITLPGVAYYAWVFLFNPAYAEWNALNQTITPELGKIISGFGLVFFLTLYFWWSEHREKRTTKTVSKNKNKANAKKLQKKKAENFLPITFLTVWIITQFILIYIPVNVQRRFIMGLHIPLCILATFALIKLTEKIRAKKFQYNLVWTVLILFLAATTVLMTAAHIKDLQEPKIGEYSNTAFLTPSEVEAIKFIEDNLDNNAIIFAPLHISNHIPAQTNNKVYVGHWAQTINYEDKRIIMKDAYEQQVVPENIVVDYVWWPASLRVPPGPIEPAPAYISEEIILYKYKK